MLSSAVAVDAAIIAGTGAADAGLVTAADLIVRAAPVAEGAFDFAGTAAIAAAFAAGRTA